MKQVKNSNRYYISECRMIGQCVVLDDKNTICGFFSTEQEALDYIQSKDNQSGF